MSRSTESYAEVKIKSTYVQTGVELGGSNDVATDPALRPKLLNLQPLGRATDSCTKQPPTDDHDTPGQPSLVQPGATLQAHEPRRSPSETAGAITSAQLRPTLPTSSSQIPTTTYSIDNFYGENAIDTRYHHSNDRMERDPTFRPVTRLVELMFGSDSSYQGKVSIPHLRSSRAASHQEMFAYYDAVLDLP